ncbi:uncharacterized protein [Cicer arietinum]|uniref:Protein odd-skipped-like n=1 Tax=Cicer arietinum TaxID=3827 RepID=A0A1S2Y1W2_CICAR|nr:protein odd-skipped-like [Cicer arietinum]
MKRFCHSFHKTEKHDDYVWPLLAHEMKKNGSRIFICDLCDKSFSSGNALGGHKASHNRSDLLQPPIKKHKLTIDSCSLSSPNDHDDVKHKHACVLCHKVFPSNKALYGHMRSHSQKDSKAIQPPLITTTSRDSKIQSNNTDDQPILPAIDLEKYFPPRSHQTKKRCSKSTIDYELINVAQILCDMSRSDPTKFTTNIDNQRNKEHVTIVKNNNNPKKLVVTFKIPKDKTFKIPKDKEEKNKEAEMEKESSHQLGSRAVAKDFDLNEIPVDLDLVADEQAP